MSEKQKIAFFFPTFCVSRPFDPANIWTSPRGMTGSEIASVMYALGLSRLGHDVTFFTRVTGPGPVEGVKFRPYEEWAAGAHREEWDSLCSWMVPEPLKYARPGTFRFLNQQVSELSLFEAGWEDWVDVFAPLSHTHAQYMGPKTRFPKDRWRILYNGVDTESFRPGQKVRGKMVWASSHDRGLHWLLEAFPRIRKAVPEAHLHVFYNFEGIQHFAGMTPEIEAYNPTYPELARRSRYTLDAFRRLRGHGVEVHESVSRDRIREEMASAEVLAYPCDPVLYTETFGVTVLEACAAGAVPVLCTADSFGELWGTVGLSVPPPYKDHKDKFAEHVISVLSDPGLRGRLAAGAVDRAKAFAWPALIKGLETCLLTKGASGLPHVIWDSSAPSSLPPAPPPSPIAAESVKLNVGCGPNIFPAPGWVNYDRVDMSEYIETSRSMPEQVARTEPQRALLRFLKSNPVDFRKHDFRKGLSAHADGSVDAIYFGQVLEHLNPLFEAPQLMREFRRVLRPGGVLRVVTPDLDLLVRAYVGGTMSGFMSDFPDFYKQASPDDQLSYVMFGSAGSNSTWDNYEGHMHLYTKASVGRLFREAGFANPPSFPRTPGLTTAPELFEGLADCGLSHSLVAEVAK